MGALSDTTTTGKSLKPTMSCAFPFHKGGEQEHGKEIFPQIPLQHPYSNLATPQ